MTGVIVDFLSQFPRGLATVLLAGIPIGELRLAIPVAIEVWLLHPIDAVFLALLGNILPFFPLYFGLNWVRKHLDEWWPWAARQIDLFVGRAEGRVKEKYNRYGAVALALFTGIPFPLTGLYTATVAAVVLKIPWKQALAGILLGLVIASIIVLSVTVGLSAILSPQL
jgi:uncharacterized membrane protein